jgi:hypothetical protein
LQHFCFGETGAKQERKPFELFRLDMNKDIQAKLDLSQ